MQMCVMSVGYEVLGKYQEANRIVEVDMEVHVKIDVGGEGLMEH